MELSLAQPSPTVTLCKTEEPLAFQQIPVTYGGSGGISTAYFFKLGARYNNVLISVIYGNSNGNGAGYFFMLDARYIYADEP